ncbi:PCRF domain-containing protein, partial [Staphylococcus pasteuri]|uniref:PCRF domain-containing protein n=1 Tax=Staphylococcus pasteuri TaxID=45972 RepID=UPI0012B80F4A
HLIVHIRPPPRPDQPAIFPPHLITIYSNYPQIHNFKTQILQPSQTHHAAYKQLTFSLSPNPPYTKLKFQNPPHPLQPLPQTQSRPTIHTSTPTLALFPQLEHLQIELTN